MVFTVSLAAFLEPMIFFRIFRESFKFALHALVVNKLRTILSLLGITIGIFTIISVFTVVDSLERNIRSSIDGLGSNVVYVQKWPWSAEDGEYKWWQYFQRPEPGFKEVKKLEKRMTTAANIAYGYGFRKTVKFSGNSVDNATIMPVSHDYYNIWSHELEQGRYFSDLESKNGPPVAVIGKDIADGLFGNINPLGQQIKLLGRKVRVIGVFERQGQSMVGQDVDEMVLLPVNYARSLMNLSRQNGAMIMVAAKEGVELAELKDELRGKMRSIRKLKPIADDNFALNEISLLANGLDELFGVIGLAGGAIGIFSILVGGFGIANIMFVSVRERTNQIGIQKSLGAKNSFIRSQFLIESVVLCLIGGTIGLLVIFGGLELIYLLVPDLGLEIAISFRNVMQGLILSVSIGLIAGFIPAWKASRLDPVEAIRTGV